MAYYIEKGCIGCHYCELECPASAIYIQHGFNQIDQDKCIECGACVDRCRLDLIKSTEPEPVPAPHDPVELSCQVLVVGAGGVGTGAAARAADLGLDTILIEAAKWYGGGTWFAHGGQFHCFFGRAASICPVALFTVAHSQVRHAQCCSIRLG